MVCISLKMMCLLQAIVLCSGSLWLDVHRKKHDSTLSASVVKTLAVTLINPSLCWFFVAFHVPASTLVFSPLSSLVGDPLWTITDMDLHVHSTSDDGCSCRNKTGENTVAPQPRPDQYRTSSFPVGAGAVQALDVHGPSSPCPSSQLAGSQ